MFNSKIHRLNNWGAPFYLNSFCTTVEYRNTPIRYPPKSRSPAKLGGHYYFSFPLQVSFKMDLRHVSPERAQEMMPYLRAMLRNIEHGIIPVHTNSDEAWYSDCEDHNSDSDPKDKNLSSFLKENESAERLSDQDMPSTSQKDDSSDADSNCDTYSEIEGSVAASEDTLFTSTSELSNVSADSLHEPVISWKAVCEKINQIN